MKLIDILVNSLEDNGGWHPDVECYACDSSTAQEPVRFIAYGYTTKEIKFNPSIKCWSVLGCGKSIITSGLKIPISIGVVDDYETSVVTKEQYESALATKNEGWIAWGGGECPVGKDSLVIIKLRSGKLHDNGAPQCLDSIEWSHNGGCYDVIAYRLHKPEVKSVEWNGEGLPPVGVECEVQIGRNKFNLCRIVYSDKNSGAAFIYLGGDDEKYCGQIDCVNASSGAAYFRPLRTEADRKRELAIEEMCNVGLLLPAALRFSREEMGALYDAGFRKQ